ncbi:MAG: hypothetical protein JRN52_02345 [Nitrososphaerota archaeon]|nr:hypothetical protein [Nitrososphaerota archaeon]
MTSVKLRSQIRISIDILRAVEEEGPAKPTRILQKANLSHDRLVKYLQELVTKNLIAESWSNGCRYYTLTKSGAVFLEEIERSEASFTGLGLTF